MSTFRLYEQESPCKFIPCGDKLFTPKHFSYESNLKNELPLRKEANHDIYDRLQTMDSDEDVLTNSLYSQCYRVQHPIDPYRIQNCARNWLRLKNMRCSGTDAERCACMAAQLRSPEIPPELFPAFLKEVQTQCPNFTFPDTVADPHNVKGNGNPWFWLAVVLIGMIVVSRSQ